jgi:hypothetical protein
MKRGRGGVILMGLVVALGGIARGQQLTVGAMYVDDQQRERALSPSFSTMDLPAVNGAPSARVYLSAGDLERAFDAVTFRPDAAIVPTNIELLMTATSPATQRVLVDRVRKRPGVLRDLDDQAAARRRQLPAAADGTPATLQIGVDTFVAQLPRGAADKEGSFPRSVCMVATDFADGRAVDRRDLSTQDRVRKGIAACLTALDRAGAQTVMMPLMGASSSESQSKDPVFEGQRLLKECRLINSVAGLALGIHDFAPARRTMREIGIVQWSREITDMFGLPNASKIAQSSYRIYAEQVAAAWRKGLQGEKTTAGDAGGNCALTFNGQ